ncbi:MAG: hypothetical protein WDN48_05335 [Pseudolabrys sp.]
MKSLHRLMMAGTILSGVACFNVAQADTHTGAPKNASGKPAILLAQAADPNKDKKPEAAPPAKPAAPTAPPAQAPRPASPPPAPRTRTSGGAPRAARCRASTRGSAARAACRAGTSRRPAGGSGAGRAKTDTPGEA